MRKVYIAAFVLILISIPVASFAWVRFRQAPEKPPTSVSISQPKEYTLEIKGDKQCIQDTNDALDNLRFAAPAEYSNVKRYIGIIECIESNSGIAVKENPPRFQVGKPTYESSYGSMWYASVLAHEACHSRLYREYLAAHPKQQVPLDAYGGRPGEETCLSVQAGVLKKLGAGDTLINSTLSAINTDYWLQNNRPY